MRFSAKRGHHCSQSPAIHRRLWGRAGRSDQDDLTQAETESGTADLVEVLPDGYVADQHGVLEGCRAGGTGRRIGWRYFRGCSGTRR